ncbi:MAG: efflux RND transporter periplasmic adaptor subunit [Clostridiales bacterium]|nr:efflux RND transporter periplasmic adaptor subunit [Clostridiales bacterium]
MNNQIKNFTQKLNKKIYIALTIIVIAGCVLGYYFLSVSMSTFSTDNARVTAKMYPISAVSSGKLLEWNVREGDLVQKDEVLGRQETLPYIVSPINGTVVKSDVQAGQSEAVGSQLAIIADTDHMYIGVNIEETKIMKIAVGDRVDVKIDAYKGKIFHGKITEIQSTTQTYFSGISSFTTSGTYNKVTQLIPVKVEIENKENLPMAFGMNAQAKIYF